MKKFEFSLQAVVVVRELALNRAEAAYAQAQRACSEHGSAIESMKKNIAALQGQVEQVRGDQFCAATQQHYMLAQTHAFEVLALQEKNLEQLREDAREKLNIYVQARKAYDGLVQIRERKYQEHLKQVLQREERDLEDIYCNRYSISMG